jgi:hypothetical protein
MLKLLRNKKLAKKIWITMAILILPAFLFWGFGSAMRNRNEEGFAGQIFGKKITNEEYKGAIEAVRNIAIMRYGENFSETEKQINLKSQAWERLIFLHEARASKIKASDREVIELIESYPFFQNKGVFDNRIYSEITQYVFHTQPRVFEEQVRENIIISKLYDQVIDKVAVDDKEIREAYIKKMGANKNGAQIDEKKYTAEKEAFGRILLEQKKQETFAKFFQELLVKAQLK